MDWLFDTLLLSIAGSLLIGLVTSIAGPMLRTREHCDCAVPTFGTDGPRCSDCGRPLDVTTGDRPGA